jgi:hypothetical protein
MEYCSIDDAFPAQGASAPGCRGSDSSSSQRREERRRAKRCKGPQQKFLDADRQGFDFGEEPNPMRGSGALTDGVNPFNPETGMQEHAPLTADTAYGQEEEALAQVPRSAYTARRPPTSTAAAHVKLRETEGPRTLISSASAKPPAYFGADPDADISGFSNSNNMSDGFQNFSPIEDNKEYMLETDFAHTFGSNTVGQGLRAENKASGATLPIPSIVDAWKRLTPSGANTAFIEHLPSPGGSLMPPPDSYSSLSRGLNMNDDMKRRLDEIFSRLDDLESSRSPDDKNTQMEIFLFILSGMFVMFTVDMFARR